jgi:hypothetical protein
MEHLPQAELVAEKALSETLEQHIDSLVQPSQGDQALHFVTSLPCLNRSARSASKTTPEPEAERPAEPEPKQIAPTHLLKGALATALSPTGIALGDSAELYNANNHWLVRGSSAIRVNGEEYVPGQALLCGDRIDWIDDGSKENPESTSAVLIAVVKTRG